VSTRTTRVLIVDDHGLVVDALSARLSAEPDIEVAGVATSVAEVRGRAHGRYDVVLMDYRLPDGTGADATRIVKGRWPTARVIMLTAVTDDETLLECVQAGADGYVSKEHALSEIVDAVRKARDGETLLPEAVLLEIARRVAEQRDRGPAPEPVEPLTGRQLEVLRALATGESSASICRRLGISPNTLRTHVQAIIGKLHAHTKLEAVAVALRLRLIALPGVQSEGGSDSRSS
jgi:DNA-binding NarL/FixJ family response regulator